MKLESISNVYRAHTDGIRVIEWSTKTANGHHYHTSRTYTIHLYSREGKLQEYTNQRKVDLYV